MWKLKLVRSKNEKNTFSTIRSDQQQYPPHNLYMHIIFFQHETYPSTDISFRAYVFFFLTLSRFKLTHLYREICLLITSQHDTRHIRFVWLAFRIEFIRPQIFDLIRFFCQLKSNLDKLTYWLDLNDFSRFTMQALVFGRYFNSIRMTTTTTK